jgi:fatty-acid desaturase
MGEYTPKTDEEIEWEELVHNAEKEDFKRRQKKSLLEVAFETILEITRNALLGLIFWAVLPFLLIYLCFYSLYLGLTQFM